MGHSHRKSVLSAARPLGRIRRDIGFAVRELDEPERFYDILEDDLDVDRRLRSQELHEHAIESRS